MLSEQDTRDLILETLLNQAQAIVVQSGFNQCQSGVVSNDEMDKMAKILQLLTECSGILKRDQTKH